MLEFISCKIMRFAVYAAAVQFLLPTNPTAHDYVDNILFYV